MNKAPADAASRPPAQPSSPRPAAGLSLPGTRILQILPRLESGGVEQVTVETCRFIREAGGRPSVASAGGRMVASVLEAGAFHYEMPLDRRSPSALALNALRLTALVRREGIELIHVRSRAPAISALWAGRATGTPVVATYHGVYSAGSRIKRWYNSVMTRGALTFANSAFTREHVLAEHRLGAERLLVTPEGVDTTRFDPAAVSPARLAQARQMIGAGELGSAPVILLPARLTGWKGQSVAIAALARLAGRTSARLVLAGRPRKEADRDELVRAAQAAGVGDRVSLIGAVSDMPALLLVADVVVAPSTLPESFGRSVAEACAMERFVIASALGGAAEVVIDGETGRLAPPGEVEAWTDAIAAALAMSPEARLEVGRRARRRIVDNFSLESMAQSTLGAYRRVLGIEA